MDGKMCGEMDGEGIRSQREGRRRASSVQTPGHFLATKPRSGTDRARFGGMAALPKSPTWAFAAQKSPSEAKGSGRRAVVVPERGFVAKKRRISRTRVLREEFARGARATEDACGSAPEADGA